LLKKKEVQQLEKTYERLHKELAGVRDMNRLPDILFVIDAKKEEIPVREAKKLGIPIIAICDTNTDPSTINYPIPANDDAIKSIKLISQVMADAVLDGSSGGQLVDRGRERELEEELEPREVSEKAELYDNEDFLEDDGKGRKK